MWGYEMDVMTLVGLSHWATFFGQEQNFIGPHKVYSMQNCGT
jgi:hypothetical protein